MRRVGMWVVALSAVMVVGLAGPASASNNLVERTAGLVERVAPDQGRLAKGALEGDGVHAHVNSIDVTVPRNPRAAVTLARGSSVLKVGLPSEVDVGESQVAQDGTVVYRAAHEGAASAAVQVLAGGSVRLQTVAPSASSAKRFTYTFGEGVRPVVSASGGIDLVSDSGRGVAIVVGAVAPAWAVDATGKSMPTSYSLHGATLVQTIASTADAVYPVVADPMVTYAWWNTTVYFDRSDTKTMASSAAGVALVALWIPEPLISKIISSIAAVASGMANWALNRNACIKFVYYVHYANIWQVYSGSEAGGYCR